MSSLLLCFCSLLPFLCEGRVAAVSLYIPSIDHSAGGDAEAVITGGREQKAAHKAFLAANSLRLRQGPLSFVSVWSDVFESFIL